MAQQKGVIMASTKSHTRLVKEIAKKYGNVIDLDRSPQVLVEILREFGHIFSPGGDVTVGGGMGPGVSGMGPGVSSIAGSGPTAAGEIENALIFKTILALQKDIKLLNRKLDSLYRK